jgi:hypothetical protein
MHQAIAKSLKYLNLLRTIKTQLVMKKLFVFALLVVGISAANAQDKTEKKERKGDKKETKSATATHEAKAEKKDAKGADKKDKAAK